MSSNTYLVTLPNGDNKGPLTLADIKQAALDGQIPREATVLLGDETITIGDAIGRAIPSMSPGSSRMTASDRADLAGTRASTPFAIQAEEGKKS